MKECTNYRTISLISHASKIMSKIIQKKKCAKLPCEQRIFLWPIGVRAGGGARGAAAPPNFGQLRFFGQQEKIWAKTAFKNVVMFFY